MSHLFDRGHHPRGKVAYIVKRYPRFSETFIVNEILAHESAGEELEIFSVRPPVDTHFQCVISQVRAPVHYLPHSGVKASELWGMLRGASRNHPRLRFRMDDVMRFEASEVAAATMLANRALAGGISHFHAHFATSAAEVAYLAHLITGIPFSITAHAKDIFHQDVDPARLRQLIEASLATITVSDFNVRYLCEQIGAGKDKVVRIYNGLNLAEFPYSKPVRRPPVLLAIGRVIEKKGFEYFVGACDVLNRRGVHFRAQLVGDGPLLSGLKERVQTLGLAHCFEFLGPQPQRRVKELVAEAAVFVAPCVEGKDGNRDGLPTVLLESMAIGTPCVSTPVTGIPEAIVDGETGCLVPCRDEIALARAIEGLLCDPEQSLKVSLAAREKIESDFNIAQNAAKLRLLFSRASVAEMDVLGKHAPLAVGMS